MDGFKGQKVQDVKKRVQKMMVDNVCMHTYMGWMAKAETSCSLLCLTTLSRKYFGLIIVFDVLVKILKMEYLNCKSSSSEKQRELFTWRYPFWGSSSREGRVVTEK